MLAPLRMTCSAGVALLHLYSFIRGSFNRRERNFGDVLPPCCPATLPTPRPPAPWQPALLGPSVSTRNPRAFPQAGAQTPGLRWTGSGQRAPSSSEPGERPEKWHRAEGGEEKPVPRRGQEQPFLSLYTGFSSQCKINEAQILP